MSVRLMVQAQPGEVAEALRHVCLTFGAVAALRHARAGVEVALRPVAPDPHFAFLRVPPLLLALRRQLRGRPVEWL